MIYLTKQILNFTVLMQKILVSYFKKQNNKINISIYLKYDRKQLLSWHFSDFKSNINLIVS